MLKKILLFVGVILLLFVGIITVRTITFESKQRAIAANPTPALNPVALKNLSTAITYQTISYQDPKQFDSSQFLAFQEFLIRTYPAVASTLKLEVVLNHTLLFEWKGEQPQLGPVVLMAHQDVVPIEEATKAIWTVDPFAGTIKDDFIWGRGACDDKINLIAIMEAVEKLLKKGFKPQRTVYLLFGHDEEIGGTGAKAVADRFRERGIKPDLVLDEGGIITREKVPGMQKPVALLGTSEKGVLTLDLTVEKGGGHSAMPEEETAIDILAKSLTRLNENRFEPRFSPSTENFIQTIGPEMPFTQKMAFANLWLFRPMIHSIYEKSNAGNAMIRTTLVPTIIKAGVKENVVPTFASVTVNLRLLPGDTDEEMKRRIREIISDDRVQIEVRDYHEATSVTSMESFAYEQVDRAVKETYDSVVATPFLMIAATDSRHFVGVSDGIIKFSPMVDPIGFHGIDERVSIDSFNKSLWFFQQLIEKL